MQSVAPAASLAQATVTTTPVTAPEGKAIATFAAGCFWCTEAVFQELDGVESAVSGYAGGTVANPTYEQVYTGATDHREALQITYDPEVITYKELLDELWRAIDPTDDGGQFVDRGYSYTAAIFYHSDEQRQTAIASKKQLINSGVFDEPVITPIVPFSTFYKAEEYHQDFYIKSPGRYLNYEQNSGRDEYKAAVWDEIKKQSN